MKFSYNWLKELSGTKKSPEELAELLLTRAFEVEEVKKYEHHLDDVVVGNVLSCEPHPNADRLKVTEVLTGERARQIVCGAPNVAAGQKVAVALPGAKLPNGAEIKETDIRGVKSTGMICAEDELGIGTDHKGIMVLPENAEVGTPFAEVFGFDDFILDVKILPNRGTDALSHYGLAREIAALEGREFPSKNLFEKSLPEGVGTGKFSVEINAEKACSAYAGLSFTLPEHMPGLPLSARGRMIMLGCHLVHPAADIANYLSLLYGQPMHAFDAEKLSGRKVVVRFAKEGEKLLTLDNRELQLTDADLVIADVEKPVALAGIMGGKDSAVSAETKNVFFEIANFDPKTIRKSRVRHGFSTDAAYLFEHGVDPSWPEKLRGEVASYFSKCIGAKCDGMIGEFHNVPNPRTVAFPFSRIEGLLGIAIPEDRALGILRSLSIDAEIADGELRATTPSFRPDLQREADIIEEIGRVYGYEHIKPVAPMFPAVVVPKNSPKAFEWNLKEFLAHRGWDEIMTYSFYGEELMRQGGVPEEAHLVLENPMNPDQKYLRAKLLPTVLEKAVGNMPRAEHLRIFEFGNVSYRGENGPQEEKRIAFSLVMRENESGDAFFALKGELECLLDFLRVEDDISFTPFENASALFHPGRTAGVAVGNVVVGVVGEAHPAFTRKFGSRKIAIAELSFSALLTLPIKPAVMEPLPRFPFVMRDITLFVSNDVAVADLETAVRESGSPLLRAAEVFDVYRKGEGKSVSFHLAFGADDRTITGRESEEALQNILKATEEKVGAKISS